jgi:hypothetical protein
MGTRFAKSRRVKVQPGEKAIAPRVDHPLGFGIENQSGRSLTVSFKYDAESHVQTVVVEEHRPARRLPGDVERTGELPV